MSHLLVVGGGGFIGRHVVARARQLGWTTVDLSLHAAGGHSEAERQVVADLADQEGLRRALAGARFDFVVNCGGYIDHAPYHSGGRSVIDGHFGGVLNLVEALDPEPLKGFVNLGSSDEYGDGPAPQVETQRERPISPYSAAKVATTQFLQMLHRTTRFPATTLRLFLAYGPGQGRARFLPQVIAGCAADEPFPVSAGEQRRDFCFIDDVVDGVFLALAKPEAHGEVINVASGQPRSIRSVIEAVCELIGRGQPQFGQVPYRPGESKELYADISKARSLLGWSPRTDLASGLRRTIDDVLAAR